DAQIFRDRAGVLGRVAYDLGEICRLTGVTVKNASVLALLLLFPERPLGEGRLAGLTVEGLARARAGVDAAIAPVSRARLDRDDASTIAAEFELAAALMRHACDRGVARLTGASQAALGDELRGIIEEYERIWRLRNREGGLVDSVARLRRLL